MAKALEVVEAPADQVGEPRSAKGRRTRARLVEAGKVVFARDGFLNARITDIAVEAGLSYGAFYHYFESKEELFREIAEQMEVQLLAMEDLPPDDEHEHEPYERIRSANRSYLAAYRKEAKLMSVIVEVSYYDDEVRKVRDRRQDEFASRLAAAVARLQKNKLADPDVDGQYAAMALGGMVARFADTLFAPGAKYDFNTAVEQLSILWANALGLPRPAPAARKSPRKDAAASKPAAAGAKRRSPRSR
jgi:AcrR family transcriptional regulator